MKNRLPISRAKEGLYTFLESQAEIEIAMQGIDGYPMLEKAHYKYSQGIHVLMLVRTSSLLNKVKDGDCLSGMVFEKEGGLEISEAILWEIQVPQPCLRG